MPTVSSATTEWMPRSRTLVKTINSKRTDKVSQAKRGTRRAAFSGSQKLFLSRVEKCEDEAERPGRPPVKKGRVAVDGDLLQSGRMRHRRHGRGIHLVDRKLLCHGFVCSALLCGCGVFLDAVWSSGPSSPVYARGARMMSPGVLRCPHVLLVRSRRQTRLTDWAVA